MLLGLDGSLLRRETNFIRDGQPIQPYVILDWLSYLTLERRQTTRNLCSSGMPQLVMSLETGNFQDLGSMLFNSLPNEF